ncbi:MAG: NUDIX hydrolase [Candidatus Riflebacteria bacterium]|nr:NUDIX hydrolase [Candidatus Riflebacteria bacterium]
MNYIEEIKGYLPVNEQEHADKQTILKYVSLFCDNILTRENIFAHITGSSIILNKTADKTLMVYHNIYKSWSWTGGHADGAEDLFALAAQEAKEETGIKNITPINEGRLASIDVLPVWGHFKKNKYISSHLHLSLAYLFEADESEVLTAKLDENSGVKWIKIDEIEQYVSEPDMLPVYKKLFDRARNNVLTAK